MISIDHVEVYGWEAAIRGMRNPKNSWARMDSSFSPDIQIGKNDKSLMKVLLSEGTGDHRKFIRYITVTLDITAPLYWWKEFDTYKIGTVADSCSTMHKIQAKEFTLDDFSHEHLNRVSLDYLNGIIYWMNIERNAFNERGDKGNWWQLIQLLPSSYNQKRTILLNYEVLKNMYHARKDHKLDEWHTFCDWIKTLPESWIITGEENGSL